MEMPEEENVSAIYGRAKIKKLAAVAKRHDWHGRLDIEQIDGQQVATLEVTRNDESLVIGYTDNAMSICEYKIFDMQFPCHCASVAKEKLAGWPDVVELFKLFPDRRRVDLVKTYRKLPFNWQEDDNQEILDKLIGKRVWWYSHISQKIRDEYVMIPRRASQVFEIKPVGHRKLFNFTAAETGMRSVMLDTILKVQ
jgi:hypothetical protein